MSEQKISLIVDSGSTKSDWVVLGMSERETYQTKGFNPVFHDVHYIVQEIRENAGLLQISHHVKVVFFYGAGCSSKERNAVVEAALSSIFTNAKISVDHDLTACAYATYEGLPTISCILGTGSNACFFDGVKITQAVPSLGYVLGDEGSGAYFGKKLLSEFLYGRMPEDLHTTFLKTNQLTKDEVINKVYRQANPNTYLSSFTRFLVENSDHSYIRSMVFEGFRVFNEIHVCSYANFKEEIGRAHV